MKVKDIMTRNLLLLAAAAMTFVACNNDDDVLDNSPVAAQVNAEISRTITSRASGTTWATGDAIGISTTTTSAGKTVADNVQYTYTNSGFTTTTPIYFQDTETVTFRAYYPYTATADMTDGKIAINTSDQSEQTSFDCLFASGATASITSPTVSFTGDNAFKHCMSQVTLTFKAGNGVDDLSKLTAYTLGGLVLEGTFNTTDGTTETNPTATATDLTVALSGVTGGEYTSSVILLPQQTSDNSIALSLTLDGVTYSATLALPQSTENKLEAGFNIAYDVTISKTGITASNGEITDWTTVTGDSQMATYIPLGDISAAQATKGDFAMIDGTFLSKDADLSPRQKAGCVGIVFWTTADSNTSGSTPAKLTDDAVMSADFPSCTHGLIVSVKDASQSCAWQGVYEDGQQKNYESVYDTFQNTALFNADGKSYTAIESGIAATDNINKILGYQSTQVLRAYNKYCSETSGKGDYTVQAVAALDQWAASNPAPANTTGWFLPSVKELHMLCYKDVDNVWGAYGSEKTDTKNLVNGSLSKVSGNQFGSYYYWSSLEYAYSGSLAFGVGFRYADVGYFNKGSTVRVRAVCAY